MTHAPHSRPTLRPLLAAAALALACTGAPAATLAYSGQVDSGPLAGSPFGGSFAYADPAPGFDGAVNLSSFTLDFNSHNYTLAGADAPALAWFVAGGFIGVDYLDLDSFATAVQLTAGFSSLAEASFSYQTTGATQGLGGFTRFTPVSAVPEPATLAMVLGALGLLAAGWAWRQGPAA